MGVDGDCCEVVMTIVDSSWRLVMLTSMIEIDGDLDDEIEVMLTYFCSLVMLGIIMEGMHVVACGS